MNNNYLNTLKNRNKILSSSLLELKGILLSIFENNRNAGVIDRGYYPEFNNVLLQYKKSKLIDEWLLSEDEFVFNENLVKIPIVDVVVNGNNNRLFIISD